MMYVKSLLWALLALTLCLPARAQDEAPEPDEKRHWEVGIDLLPLLDRGILPLGPKNNYSYSINQEKLINAASVFARYHFATEAGRELAFRLRVGFNGSRFDSTLLSANFYHNPSYWGAMIRPGLEWQRNRSPKLQYYSGVDVSTRYGRSVLEAGFNDLIGLPPVLEFIEQRFVTSEFTVGLHGFVGVKYKINRFLSLSAETSVEGFFQWESYKALTNGFSGGLAPQKDAAYATFRPLSIVLLSFHL